MCEQRGRARAPRAAGGVCARSRTRGCRGAHHTPSPMRRDRVNGPERHRLAGECDDLCRETPGLAVPDASRPACPSSAAESESGGRYRTRRSATCTGPGANPPPCALAGCPIAPAPIEFAAQGGSRDGPRPQRCSFSMRWLPTSQIDWGKSGRDCQDGGRPNDLP